MICFSSDHQLDVYKFSDHSLREFIAVLRHAIRQEEKTAYVMYGGS
jgi:galactose-1-phosphate uridylyltransferase